MIHLKQPISSKDSSWHFKEAMQLHSAILSQSYNSCFLPRVKASYLFLKQCLVCYLGVTLIESLWAPFDVFSYHHNGRILLEKNVSEFLSRFHCQCSHKCLFRLLFVLSIMTKQQLRRL